MQQRQEEFVRLLRECQDGLLRYIHIHVPHYPDALDVLQSTATELWEKFDQYDSGRPFRAWARKFAHIQVLRFHMHRQRQQKNLHFYSEQTVRVLSDEYDAHEEVLAAREQALDLCFRKLSPDDRHLIEQHYWQQTSLRAIAQQEAANEDWLSRRMRKIRTLLRVCIERTLSEQGIA